MFSIKSKHITIFISNYTCYIKYIVTSINYLAARLRTALTLRNTLIYFVAKCLWVPITLRFVYIHMLKFSTSTYEYTQRWIYEYLLVTILLLSTWLLWFKVICPILLRITRLVSLHNNFESLSMLFHILAEKCFTFHLVAF